MRGEVTSVDSLSGDGHITGDDGAQYAFRDAKPRPGLCPSLPPVTSFVADERLAGQFMVLIVTPVHLIHHRHSQLQLLGPVRKA